MNGRLNATVIGVAVAIAVVTGLSTSSSAWRTLVVTVLVVGGWLAMSLARVDSGPTDRDLLGPPLNLSRSIILICGAGLLAITSRLNEPVVEMAAVVAICLGGWWLINVEFPWHR